MREHARDKGERDGAEKQNKKKSRPLARYVFIRVTMVSCVDSSESRLKIMGVYTCLSWILLLMRYRHQFLRKEQRRGKEQVGMDEFLFSFLSLMRLTRKKKDSSPQDHARLGKSKRKCARKG